MRGGPKGDLFRQFRRLESGMSIVADDGHGDNKERAWLGPDSLVHRTVVARWTATTIRLISRAEIMDEAETSDVKFVRVSLCMRYVLKAGTTLEETDVLPDKRLVDCFGCMH